MTVSGDSVDATSFCSRLFKLRLQRTLPIELWGVVVRIPIFEAILDTFTRKASIFIYIPINWF